MAGEEKAWQRLWKSQVPSKIRLFLWRLARQSLPTGDVRCHRNMAETSACSICGAEDSWRHSLINCSMARCVWALVDEGVTEHMCLSEEPSAKQWLFAMMETLSRDDFARMAVTTWAIWFARRKIIFDDELQSPLSTHLFVESYLRDLSISSSHSPSAAAPRQAHPRWILPLLGCAKINTDATTAKQGAGGAVAAVRRDAKGVFLGASTLTIDGISDPTVLEAMACREALALAQDLHLQRITVASDCISVINAMSQPFAGNYSMILEEIRATGRSFTEATFRHENRASNSEAHRLARSAVSSSVGRQVWLLQPPDGLCIPMTIIP